VPVRGAQAEIIPLEPERVMPLREAKPIFGPLQLDPCPFPAQRFGDIPVTWNFPPSPSARGLGHRFLRDLL